MSDGDALLRAILARPDEDGAWLVRDPAERRVHWVDIRAEATPAERDANDLFPAFLRLRYPGIAVALPA